MIFSNHFGIRFQPKGQGSAPTNDYAAILTCATQVASAFIFAMVACLVSQPWSLLCCIAVALILFFRLVTVAVFFYAVIAGRYATEYTRRFYMSSIIFWGWWPMLLMFCTLLATIMGTLTGSYIWGTCLSPYYELKKLQMYKDIDPSNIPGQRVQDAGLVDFTKSVEMDRGKGGCYMNHGNTYCVAPIVNGGEVKYGLAGAPRTGSYDYFAVGINCCACPNRDFQCGEWRNPLASGGLRSLDYESRPFYKLALDDWTASYGKATRNPLFFEWVQAPEYKWKGMWNRALQLWWFAFAGAISMGLSIGFLADKALQVLWQHDIIGPRCCFAPAPFCEQITLLLLPKMYYRYQQEQSDIASMPVGTDDWEGERGPGSAVDDKRVAQDYGTTNRGQNNEALSSVMAPPGAPMGSGPVFY